MYLHFTTLSHSSLSFAFVSFCFVMSRFVSLCLVSFRFVSFSHKTACRDRVDVLQQPNTTQHDPGRPEKTTDRPDVYSLAPCSRGNFLQIFKTSVISQRERFFRQLPFCSLFLVFLLFLLIFFFFFFSFLLFLFFSPELYDYNTIILLPR